MFANFLLILHLLGAGLTGAVVILGVVTILQRKFQRFSTVARGLSLMLVWQVLTGSGLSLIHWLNTGQSGSLFVFCRNLGVYLTVVGIELLILARQSRPWPRLFPRRFVALAGALSLLVILLVGHAVFSSGSPG